MTATITSIHGDQPPPRDLPDPSGTDFVHETRDGYTEPFYAREPGSGDNNYSPLAHSLREDYETVRATNANELRKIALQVLSEPRVTDPNVRYARSP